MASLYYVGKLKSNNKQFDACKEGKPFKFRVGQGEVIKAWDIGISGMKVGLLFYRCISVKNGKSLSYPLIKKLDWCICLNKGLLKSSVILIFQLEIKNAYVTLETKFRKMWAIRHLPVRHPVLNFVDLLLGQFTTSAICHLVRMKEDSLPASQNDDTLKRIAFLPKKIKKSRSKIMKIVGIIFSRWRIALAPFTIEVFIAGLKHWNVFFVFRLAVRGVWSVRQVWPTVPRGRHQTFRPMPLWSLKLNLRRSTKMIS